MSDEETERWAAVGRVLMRFRLEDTAGDVERSFRAVAQKIERGERIVDDDILMLRNSLNAAEDAVSRLEETASEENNDAA